MVFKDSGKFFCPLCRQARLISIKKQLSPLNFAQIVALTTMLTFAFFSWAQFKTLFIFFPIWILFEGTQRLRFRSQVSCPHCGFDATWYKRDRALAKRRVEAFWEAKQVGIPSPETLVPPEPTPSANLNT